MTETNIYSKKGKIFPYSGKMDSKDTAISKGVETLRVIADDVHRFSDIKQRLGLSNSTTHRILRNLECTGLVIKDPINKNYYMSNEILKWASKEGVSHRHLVISAIGELEHLQKISRETIVICKRVGTQKVIVEELPSAFSVKFTYGKGFGAPIHTGASGRALLSLLDDHEVKLILNNIQLLPATDKTITDMDILLHEIKKVRQLGYAISFGEASQGTAAISVPLQDGTKAFTLTVVGPENRFLPEKLISKVVQSANKISNLYRSRH